MRHSPCRPGRGREGVDGDHDGWTPARPPRRSPNCCGTQGWRERVGPCGHSPHDTSRHKANRFVPPKHNSPNSKRSRLLSCSKDSRVMLRHPGKQTEGDPKGTRQRAVLLKTMVALGPDARKLAFLPASARGAPGPSGRRRKRDPLFGTSASSSPGGRSSPRAGRG